MRRGKDVAKQQNETCAKKFANFGAL